MERDERVKRKRKGVREKGRRNRTITRRPSEEGTSKEDVEEGSMKRVYTGPQSESRKEIKRDKR